MCINIERGSKKHCEIIIGIYLQEIDDLLTGTVSWTRSQMWGKICSLLASRWWVDQFWNVDLNHWLEEAHIYKLFSYLNVFNWSVFVQVQLQCPIGRDSKVPQQFLDGDYNLYSFYISCNQGDYFFFFFTNFCWLSEAFNFLMIILAFPFHAFTPFKIK